MGQRKVPLVIHVDPLHLVALNYTCRYCSECDLLIAHKHEVEHVLTGLFLQYDPQAVGNEYLVLGTLEKRACRRGMRQPELAQEMRAHMHDFRTYYQELRLGKPCWYRAGQTPPVMEPPPSQEWVKSQHERRRG